MKFQKLWSAASLVIITLPATVFSQQGTIQSILVEPDPPCAGRETTFQVMGTGTCQQAYLQVDAPNSAPISATNTNFPMLFTHVYSNPGDYLVRAGSDHPQCLGEPQLDLQVVEESECLTSLNGGVLEDLFNSLRPKISGGLGLVQPGNPFPILIFGNDFGSEPGRIFLEGQFGSVELPVLESGADRTFASTYFPEGICGVADHEASLQVVASSLWWSKPFPVEFTAKREVQLFPQVGTQLMHCSTDSSCDLCNEFFDLGDEGCFSARDPNASIAAFHYNPGGEPSSDSGNDADKIDISGGNWLIESWDFNVNVDPGEGWAHAQHNNPYLEQLGEFSIDWMVTPNDSLSYTLPVYISGPCGTSYQPGVASSALTAATENLIAIAREDAMSARAVDGLHKAKRQLNAQQIRIAETQDRQVQHELAQRRAAVTDSTVDQARELDTLRSETFALRKNAGWPDADRQALKSKAGELLRRAQTVTAREQH